MYSIPKFTIHEGGETNEGVFEWGNSRDELFELYYGASDLFYMGELKDAKKEINNILGKDPYFIDGYNLSGDIELSLGNRAKALTQYQKALEMGRRIIPDDFEGHIRWGFTENRPYLSSLNALGMYHLNEGNQEKATELFEQLLEYNPDDNQGIRFIIGDLYFLQNKFTLAKSYYEANLDFPPYLYSYGLLHFSLGNKVKAITFFRKAILENIYISDLLRSKVPLIPYEIWYASSFEMPDIAYDYTDIMIFKWLEFPEALDMLQYLHSVYPSHAEINEVYLLKNELYFVDNASFDEGATEMRGEILESIEEIKADITNKTSKQILEKWENSPYRSNNNF